VPNRDEFGAQAARLNRMSGEIAPARGRAAAAALAAGAQRQPGAGEPGQVESGAGMSHADETRSSGSTEMMRDGLYGDVPDEE
jgi:hypothetical protein